MITEALAPLQPLLTTPSLSEVMVQADGHVGIECRGVIEETGLRLTQAQMQRIGLALAAHARRDFAPLMNGSLPTGERYQWTSEPVTRDGSTLTIRLQARNDLDFADFGMTPADSERVLALLARGGSLIVGGGTASGKTSLTGLLLRQTLFREARCILIEDQAELPLPGPRSIRMQHDGDHSARALMRAAMRMRPDHIILGEVRDAEAFELLQAVNTGHGGSICTVHASPGGAARRLADLAGYSGRTIPPGRFEQAFAGVLQVERQADDSRTTEFTAWSTLS
ncbi:MAG: CpaF family protein [Geminicoccaceae bacterium]|nr:CpaF family protein [Geminicoccaceae bacterium]